VTVKAKVGRSRYLAFQVEGAHVSRGNLGAILPPIARLTRFDGSFGIVRCTHRDLDAVKAVLNAAYRIGGRDVRLTTLATSGTIRQAALALPPESSASKRAPRKID
jgi:RNase P/RNase MRP subunit POP5